MKILYIGAVDFSYHCLLEVLKRKGNVVGVVTLKKSSDHSDFRDLTPIARRYDLPIFYCKDINALPTLQWIKKKTPDIIFCWGWSQIIRSQLLSVPPMGILGSHPSLLPQNRGRHPLIWALVLGLRKTGLTFFFMDQKADSGPILSQKKIKIHNKDTATTLYGKIKTSASSQIRTFLPQLMSGRYQARKQDDGKANYWRKRSVEDGVINWGMNAQSVLNLIRALSRPYPGAQMKYKGQMVTVWEACFYPQRMNSFPASGKVIKIQNGKPVIQCYDGAIVLKRFEPRISFIAGEYLR